MAKEEEAPVGQGHKSSPPAGAEKQGKKTKFIWARPDGLAEGSDSCPAGSDPKKNQDSWDTKLSKGPHRTAVVKRQVECESTEGHTGTTQVACHCSLQSSDQCVKDSPEGTASSEDGVNKNKAGREFSSGREIIPKDAMAENRAENSEI